MPTRARTKKPSTPQTKSAKSKKPVPPAKSKKSAQVSKPPRPAKAKAPMNGDAHGSEAAFQRFLPAARTLPDAAVQPLRFDAELALHNVRSGVAALLPYQKQLASELPRLNLNELFELTELGLGLLFAVGQTVLSAEMGTKREVLLRDLLSEGQQLRSQLLSAADTLVAYDRLPAATVVKIRTGRGSIDMARDLGDLSALFGKYADAFRKNTPATPSQARRAAEVGAELLKRLSPGSARRKTAAAPSEIRTDRDRLATLLVQRHRNLRRAGYWIWGDEFDTHVPPLLARRSSRPSPKKAPTPETPTQ